MNREEMLRRLQAGEDPLDLSIEKWQNIVDCVNRIRKAREFPEELEQGCGNCALCEAYLGCVDCPIRQRTKSISCLGTPYYRFRMAWHDGAIWTMRLAAREMLWFLKRLKDRQDGNR